MERYVCIHGHFYQPPRENPWLEAVELQDSAYPYHDWNERVTAECYAPNSVSRILDERNRIVRLVNNYARISFDFGPTLLSWLEIHAADVYEAILEADRESRKRFSGHGSALAQPYNHAILPLANRRDRETQILWGIADFEHRFGRPPEGMWLPETAVDVDTLELLAQSGIRFTILAPHQAARVRRLGEHAWRELNREGIDPSQAYEQCLPSGRRIALFFYDGPISRAVAFEGLLSRGENFAHRLVAGFSDERDWAQLVHIATDGESYGHHHRFGDMALAYALNYLEARGLARLTNYGEYLAKHPPTHQVEIVEKSSWSCFHGVERWRSDCGCNTGAHPGWNQAWRTPLRNSLDWLRDTLVPAFEREGRKLFRNPWVARNDYIRVILDRSPDNVRRFIELHSARRLGPAEVTVALKLLEMQRHAMLMYTSCGWFFDDLGGIETVQILQYAARALQLAEEVFGEPLERQWLERLAEARSNLPDLDGRGVYDRHVRPARVDWWRLGAHYAVTSLFESYPERVRIYCFTAEREDYRVTEAGRARLAVGRVRLTSEVSLESAALSFGVLHFGDHNVTGGAHPFTDPERYEAFGREVVEPFRRADFAEVVRLMDYHFGDSRYSIRSLFRDEQRKILDTILATALEEAEALYRQIYEPRAATMRFLAGLGIPPPKMFYAAAELVLNGRLRRALERDPIDTERVAALLENARVENVSLDTATLEFACRRTLERLADRFAADPSAAALDELDRSTALLDLLPFRVDLWKIQNAYYRVLETVYPERRRAADAGDPAARAWAERFVALGGKLAVNVS